MSVLPKISAESPDSGRAAASHQGARFALDGAAALLVAVLPVLMAFANRSSPLVMGIAALLCVGGAVLEWGAGRVLAAIKRIVLSPEGIASLLLLAWALVSIDSSVDRRQSMAT